MRGSCHSKSSIAPTLNSKNVAAIQSLVCWERLFRMGAGKQASKGSPVATYLKIRCSKSEHRCATNYLLVCKRVCRTRLHSPKEM